MHRLKRASFWVSLLAALCAAPTVSKLIDGYRANGRVDSASLGELIIVPLYYLIVRCAERQMGVTGALPASAGSSASVRSLPDCGPDR